MTPNANASQFVFDGELCHQGETHVVHWLVDTAAGEEVDRIRAYVGGERVAVASFMNEGPVERNATINLGLPSRRKVSLGRAHDASRRLDARIWYAAFYDYALSENEIRRNAAALLSGDTL